MGIGQGTRAYICIYTIALKIIDDIKSVEKMARLPYLPFFRTDLFPF